MTGNVVAVTRPAQVVQLTDVKRTAIYKNLRQSAAMASGLEAMAVRALEVGETTEQDLESIADLSSALHQELTRISLIINDLSGN
ncbi:hypothetical protein ACGRSR_17970 [Vibrio owensii]|jgi:hypothetical protein|uniref:hypothetical protein n=1 Tax=Vibrio owensii TaxID=696485 RepID=UPI002FEDA801